MDKKVKWGVLGFARIAKMSIIPALEKCSNAELYGVASRDNAKLDECKKLFNQTKNYTSYESFLDDPDIEAVYIPLPNSMHMEWSCKAMERGKHVLCEKPIALTAAECETMIECSIKNNVRLVESFMYQYADVVRKSIGLIREGAIGEVKQISSTYRFFLDRPNTIKMKPELGGGSLYDVGCYPVHFTGMITNTLPVAYKAEAVIDQGVDTQFSGIMRYESGVIANVNCGFNASRELHSRILGTKGILDIPETFAGKKGVITLITDSGNRTIDVEECDRYYEVVSNFTNAIQGKPAELMPLEDSLRNMRVIEGLLGAIGR